MHGRTADLIDDQLGIDTLAYDDRKGEPIRPVRRFHVHRNDAVAPLVALQFLGEIFGSETQRIFVVPEIGGGESLSDVRQPDDYRIFGYLQRVHMRQERRLVRSVGRQNLVGVKCEGFRADQLVDGLHDFDVFRRLLFLCGKTCGPKREGE